jgi:hypothetical protein
MISKGYDRDHSSCQSSVTDLERELDTLFQAPFAEFVGTRNGLAARLKKEGRDDESARVRGLAKPSFTSWLVNQLYWAARRDFDAFLKAADRVRMGEKAVLEGRKASGQADAVADRRRALDQLVAKATSRAAEEGTPLSPALTERLRTTLDAIGAYGGAAARHARGRLQEDLDPPGFAALASLSAGETRRGKGVATPATPKLHLVRSAPHPKLAEARGHVSEAEGNAARAQDAAAAAADAERRARAAADQARVRLTEAERAVKSAKAEAEAAATALKTRQAEARSAATAAANALKTLDKARDTLERLDRSSEINTWQR